MCRPAVFSSPAAARASARRWSSWRARPATQVVFTGRNEHQIDAWRARPARTACTPTSRSPTTTPGRSRRAGERMGGIDVLVNNAGYGYRAEIGALDVGAMRDDVRHQRVRPGRHHQPRRAADEGAGPRRHRQHRVDVGHEGRGDGDVLRRAASGRCAASASAGRPSCGRTASA